MSGGRRRSSGALTPADEALWRRVAATVKPIAPASRRTPPDTPAAARLDPGATGAPPATPKIAETPTAFDRWFRGGPEPAWRGPGPRPAPSLADRSGEKRVRRGRVEIGASLDLHGMTQTQARAAVERFLARAAADNAAAVIIVTGKGGRLVDGERRPSVLKERLPEWLDARRDLVSGYAQAHRRHGGEGAVYVFLRRAGGRGEPA